MSKKDITSSQKISSKFDKKSNDNKRTDSSVLDSDINTDYEEFLHIKEGKSDEESLTSQNKFETLSLLITDMYTDFKKLIFYEVIFFNLVALIYVFVI